MRHFRYLFEALYHWFCHVILRRHDDVEEKVAVDVQKRFKEELAPIRQQQIEIIRNQKIIQDYLDAAIENMQRKKGINVIRGDGDGRKPGGDSIAS